MFRAHPRPVAPWPRRCQSARYWSELRQHAGPMFRRSFFGKIPSGASLPHVSPQTTAAWCHVPGSGLAIAVKVRDDNSGPHTPEEIRQIFADLAHPFSERQKSGSEPDGYRQAIQPFRSQLPVITGEIGDTWIYGVASDPLKSRAIAKSRGCDVHGLPRENSAPAMPPTSRSSGTSCSSLSTPGEPTPRPGLTSTTTSRPTWQKMLDTKNYQVVQFSWTEKRQDLLAGISTLPAPLRAQAQQAITALTPVQPSLSAKAAQHSANTVIETNHFQLGFDPQTGASNAPSQQE